MIRIYLDNCCYNRPYDDNSFLKIRQEAEAKIEIQNEIKLGKFELVSSYILEYENAANTILSKKESIKAFLLKIVFCMCLIKIKKKLK